MLSCWPNMLCYFVFHYFFSFFFFHGSLFWVRDFELLVFSLSPSLALPTLHNNNNNNNNNDNINSGKFIVYIYLIRSPSRRSDAATNKQYLISSGITHVLNAAENLKKGPAPVKTGSEFYKVTVICCLLNGKKHIDLNIQMLLLIYGFYWK